MHQDFPLFRLATLLARQLSTPIANRIKDHVRVHPLFTRALCMGTARTFRAAELRLKLWSLRLKQPATLPPISDREAVEVGADLIGEMVIFALGAAIITFEVNRQASNKAAAKLERKSRWVAIGVALEELKTELELQQQEIDTLMTTLRGLQPGPGFKPASRFLPSFRPQEKIPYDTPAADLLYDTPAVDLPHDASVADLPTPPEPKDFSSNSTVSEEQVHHPPMSPNPPPLAPHPAHQPPLPRQLPPKRN